MWGEFLRILICLLWTSFMMIVSYIVTTIWSNVVEKFGFWSDINLLLMFQVLTVFFRFKHFIFLYNFSLL